MRHVSRKSSRCPQKPQSIPMAGCGPLRKFERSVFLINAPEGFLWSTAPLYLQLLMSSLSELIIEGTRTEFTSVVCETLFRPLPAFPKPNTERKNKSQVDYRFLVVSRCKCHCRTLTTPNPFIILTSSLVLMEFLWVPQSGQTL